VIGVTPTMKAEMEVSYVPQTAQ